MQLSIFPEKVEVQIILCHDGRTQPSRELLEAVGQSLVALADRGLTFVTGSQMLAATLAP